MNTTKNWQKDPIKHECGASHFVQFYESKSFLYKAVSLFAQSAFENKEALLIVAREELVSNVKNHLVEMGHDLSGCESDIQFKALDAQATLEKFLIDGKADAELFHKCIAKLIEPMIALYGKVWIYGEMVDLLWEQENIQSAIQLERLWNEASGRYHFTLMCAYSMQHFKKELDSDPFLKVCETHTHVTPTESFLHLEQDDQNRKIADLQQKAQALETEIHSNALLKQELSDAIQAKESFLAMLGHEIKTPLAALVLHGEVLRRILTQNKNEHKEMMLRGIETLKRSTKQLNQLINQLLDTLKK